MVELKDFVSSALKDIITGIKDAQADAAVGTLVAPSLIGHQDFPSSSGVVGKGPYLTTVKFHVAVTASETSSGGAGGGVKLAVFNANVGGGSESLNQTVSTIDFAVHVQLGEY